MQKTKMIGWAAVVGLVLAPAAALAQGSSQDAQDQCMSDCASKCANTGAGASVTPKKTHKKVKSETKIEEKSETTGSGASVGMNEPAAPAAGCSQADLDAIRAEARARAAEEFQAEQQQLNQEHQAELDRVRAEASQKSEADVAAARAEEDRRLEQRRMATEKSGNGILDIHKAPLTPIGVYGSVGGGYTNFTQPTTAATTNGGGFWDARLGLGTRSIIGLEAQYEGGARNITALGLNSSAYLLNNGIEGLARLNVPVTIQKSIVEPYAFGGVGWQHYNLMNVSTNTSDVRNNDDVLDVPLGAGLQLGYNGFTIDGRVTYRQTFFADLLGHTSSSYATNSLNSWGAGATVGFEF